MSRLVGSVEDPSVRQAEAAPACPACGGEGIKMGSLGRLEWRRCRACGTEFNRRVK